MRNQWLFAMVFLQQKLFLSSATILDFFYYGISILLLFSIEELACYALSGVCIYQSFLISFLIGVLLDLNVVSTINHQLWYLEVTLPKYNVQFAW